MARYDSTSSSSFNTAFKKTLFQSLTPGSESSKGQDMNHSGGQQLLYKVQLEQDIDLNLFHIKKDLHEQRMKELRELASSLQDDDWRFTPADQLTGLH